MATGTRSRPKNCGSEVPQLLKPLRAGGYTSAASHSDSQNKFLQYVSLTQSKIDIIPEDVFDDNMAEIISQALTHEDKSDILGEDCNDPYFTPEEWEKQGKIIRTEYDSFYDTTIINNELPGPDSELAKSYLALKRQECECKAHVSLNHGATDFVGKLIDIPKPLTDDWGKKMATTLLSLILEHGGMEGYEVEDCNPGTPYCVNFILQLPSGDSTQFTGWPDFTVTRSFSRAEGRLSRRRVQRLGSIGEIQSPKDNDEATKTQTIAQAGIYGMGQHLVKKINKMPVIVLFKDKSAQVLITRSKPSQIPVENSLGEVEYEYVEKVHSSDLTDKNELQQFSRYVISALRLK